MLRQVMWMAIRNYYTQTGRSRTARQVLQTHPSFRPINPAGTLLWTSNLGKNIQEGAHYTQFMVLRSGCLMAGAEVAIETADGIWMEKEKIISDSTKDWRNKDGRNRLNFFTVFSGLARITH